MISFAPIPAEQEPYQAETAEEELPEPPLGVIEEESIEPTSELLDEVLDDSLPTDSVDELLDTLPDAEDAPAPEEE